MTTYDDYAVTQDMKRRARASRRLAELRLEARPLLDVTGDIDRAARERATLYRLLAQRVGDPILRDRVATLTRRLDFLYEELRITRMVAA